MTEPAITKELNAKHGLTDAGYARIHGILGREPNITELAVFLVIWTERCSCENMRLDLRSDQARPLLADYFGAPFPNVFIE